MRAAMLDMLAADVQGARILELFAGTGAIGLEALSRGADRVDFVEIEPGSLSALRANIVALRVREHTRVFKQDAIPFAAALQPDSYDITFADPPYGSRKLDLVVASWRSGRFSRILALEHERTRSVLPGGRRRAFEDTAVTILRAPRPSTRR